MTGKWRRLAIAKLEDGKVKDVGIAGQWYTPENIDQLHRPNPGTPY